jgi:hypoxanthine phosphoribosyltransferase
MSWTEFDSIVSDVINTLKKVEQDNNFKFDAYAPLLRSGAIPGTMIANKMKIIPVIPIQVKNNYLDGCIDKVIEPICLNGLLIENIKNILVTECNTYMGRSASLVYKMLKEKFPVAIIHYACITRVFGGPKTIEGFETYTVGCITNEAFRDEAPKEARFGITVYPWETPEYELEDINAEF